MNYNNPYYNPYQQYPYTMQPQQPQQQQYHQPQPQQTNYLPLTFVNGIEGAKAFIVGANQVVYLKDSDSNILFEKKADYQGKYTLNAFELKNIDINNIGKPVVVEPNLEVVTKNDLNALETVFVERMNNLSSQLEKLVKTQNNEE